MDLQPLRIVLVHGSCHGAWCWYKVEAELRSRGYSVSAIDLAASGADARKIPDDVSTFDDYTKPLTELLSAIPDGEKVVLVGHSYGGLNISFAMDAFPEKIAVGVFLTAFLPDTNHEPSYVLDMQFQQLASLKIELEMKVVEAPGKSEPFITVYFGHEVTANHLYQNSSIEDQTLASMLMRPTSMFSELKKNPPLTKEGFDSVDKVYIACTEDAIITEEFQKWMVQNNGTVKEMLEIEGADHMPMFSKPNELCQCLARIAEKYSL